MKVAFVVQRYGEGFAGGAEALAKNYAEMMANDWDITVLTSCAKDMNSWANHFEPGESVLNGIKVKRFPVERERDFEKFSGYSYALESRAYALSKETERAYFKRQGPFCPRLIEFIEESKDYFDVFIFYTYLYYPTVMGLPRVASKAYLVTTAHDEPPFYFIRTYAPLFHSLKGIIFLSNNEQQLVNEVYKIPPQVQQINAYVGVRSKLDFTDEETQKYTKRFKHLLGFPYFLYVGRGSKQKRTQELIHNFVRLQQDHKMNCRLVFAGSLEVEWKQHKEIYYEGYLSEDEKSFLIKNCRAMVNSSTSESLSIMMLESWAHKRPVIANGYCDVARSLCEDSQGGLLYKSEAMFQGLLRWSTSHTEETNLLGKQGFEYVTRHYSQEKSRHQFLKFIQ